MNRIMQISCEEGCYERSPIFIYDKCDGTQFNGCVPSQSDTLRDDLEEVTKCRRIM